MLRKRSLKKIFSSRSSRLSLACLSGFLLAFSFPNFNLGFLAWVALVPLLWSIFESKNLKEALEAGALTGLVFFGITLHWLVHVIFFGWIFVATLETFFFLSFVWLVYKGRDLKRPYVRILWFSLAWTVMEFLRSEFPVFGLGWNQLGYSQADYPLIRQWANTFGAYGLGFMIVLVNVCLIEWGYAIVRLGLTKKWQVMIRRPVSSMKARGVFRYPVLIAFLISILSAHGLFYLNRATPEESTLRVSFIQGNIPQDIKWEPGIKKEVLEIHKKLSQLASYDNPDLILWPEAAFPGYLNKEMEAESMDLFTEKIGVPVLIGSPHLESYEVAYNSAYLLDSLGRVRQRYDKQYLVPFGEYVPLKLVFGWLEPLAFSLGVSDFSAGHEATVFKLPNHNVSFSVLICFEDVFSNIARDFVSRGAKFLTVITNDAWFERSAAPYQHLQASVFRAVENGVPVIRAANTGVSAFITEQGEVAARIQDAQGRDIFVTGRKTVTVPIRNVKTLFQRGGWLFPYVSVLIFLVMYLWRLKISDKRPKTKEKRKKSEKER